MVKRAVWKLWQPAWLAYSPAHRVEYQPGQCASVTVCKSWNQVNLPMKKLAWGRDPWTGTAYYTRYCLSFVKWCFFIIMMINDRQDVLIHLPLDCLCNSLLWLISKETSKLGRIDALLGNPPVTGGFPSQMVNSAEIFSMSWRLMWIE